MIKELFSLNEGVYIIQIKAGRLKVSITASINCVFTNKLRIGLNLGRFLDFICTFVPNSFFFSLVAALRVGELVKSFTAKPPKEEFVMVFETNKSKVKENGGKERYVTEG